MRNRCQIANLSRSIAQVWKPGKMYGAGSLCTCNGTRYRAIVTNCDRRFTPAHWKFEAVGESGGGGGGGRPAITETDIPTVYTMDAVRDKVNAILAWARTPAPAVLSAAPVFADALPPETIDVQAVEVKVPEIEVKATICEATEDTAAEDHAVEDQTDSDATVENTEEAVDPVVVEPKASDPGVVSRVWKKIVEKFFRVA